jgi:hypothetical protein
VVVIVVAGAAGVEEEKYADLDDSEEDPVAGAAGDELTPKNCAGVVEVLAALAGLVGVTTGADLGLAATLCFFAGGLVSSSEVSLSLEELESTDASEVESEPD